MLRTVDQYRAAVRLSSKQGELRPVSAPTLVIWGQDDRYLGPKLAEPHNDDVPNLDRVERLLNASHWVHHEEAERVNELLVDFFAPARGSQNGRTSIAWPPDAATPPGQHRSGDAWAAARERFREPQIPAVGPHGHRRRSGLTVTRSRGPTERRRSGPSSAWEDDARRWTPHNDDSERA
jgi:hypothetical protein